MKQQGQYDHSVGQSLQILCKENIIKEDKIGQKDIRRKIKLQKGNKVETKTKISRNKVAIESPQLKDNINQWKEEEKFVDKK